MSERVENKIAPEYARTYVGVLQVRRESQTSFLEV